MKGKVLGVGEEPLSVRFDRFHPTAEDFFLRPPAPASDMTQPGPATLLEAFAQRTRECATRTALIVDRGTGYTSLTWQEIGHDVAQASAGLRRVGIARGEHVAILSENRYEWLIADLALQAIGAVSVPLHLNLTSVQVEQIVEHSESRWLIVANPQHLAKLSPKACESLQGIVLFEDGVAADQTAQTVRARVQFWQNVVSSDGGAEPIEPTADPASLATIIYTSGTTGEPKGVMLSHRNLAFDAWSTWTTFGNPPSERRFGLLPWSHAFARTCDLYAWIVSGTELIVARSRESAIADMQATSPTYMNGVPYFFQKVQRSLIAAGKADDPTSARQLFGCSLRAACSGGAALADDTFEFFQRQGIAVLEGYGLTEASPVVSTNTEQVFRRGSVGRPLQGVEVRTANDGEVLVRGPNVMLGYYRDEVGTSQTIIDGWLHTGDLGHLDTDGFLHLTGRKKELIALSTGRKVSPALLEALLLQDSRIEQVVVVGDGRSELAALVVPGQDLAKEPAATALDRLQQIAKRTLADRPTHEQIRRFALLQTPLAQEAGELSAKLSLCRQTITQTRAGDIEKAYSG